MSGIFVDLFMRALLTTALLALPLVGLTAAAGVAVGLLQTILGIQDQNLSFGPKIAALAGALALGGMTALGLIEALLVAAAAALPRVAG
jgi:flagellar biosynthetic protein FliQ